MPGNVPFFSPLYRRIIATCDPKVPARLRPLWEHPCGPKTVFFWSPLQKWCLVLAGLSDTLTRPAEKISARQAGSLAATGYIWARYSLVIIPKNWALFAVNFFVGVSGTFQLAKVARYHMSLKDNPDVSAEASTEQATVATSSVSPADGSKG